MALSPNALERRAKHYLLKRTFELFVPAPPGFEAVTLGEVAELAHDAKLVPGGVQAQGGLDAVYDLNLRLRTGNRVLLRLGEFLAQSYPMLYDHARKIPWEVFLRDGARVVVSASAAGSRLRHMDHIASVVFDAAHDHLAELGIAVTYEAAAADEGGGAGAPGTAGPRSPGAPRSADRARAADAPQAAGGPRIAEARAGASKPSRAAGPREGVGPAEGAGPRGGDGPREGDAGRKPGAEPEPGAPIRLLARLHQDRCTLSLDTSGEHLHRRGYRRSIGEAPMRETLAAALLILARADEYDVILDPFTGSGTFAIEADALLRGVPPGGSRRFALEDMPLHRPGTLAHRKRLALAEVREAAGTADDSGRRKPGTGRTPPTGQGPVSPSMARAAHAGHAVRILASDLEPAAVRAALGNAERAGAVLPTFRQADALTLDLDALLGPAEHGLVIANLPYGVRLADPEAAKRLAHAFLDRLASSRGAWDFVLVTPRFDLRERPGLRIDRRLPFRNGGLDVVATFGRVG